MKYGLTLGLALIILGGLQGNAFAFSTEQTSVQIGPSTSNLKDPDEERPSFMVTPPGGASTTGLAFGSSTSPAAPLPSMDSGQDAFDHAFAHQQSGR